MIKKDFGKAHAIQLLPETRRTDHKYSRGRVLLFAGSEKYPGSGVLAARGAMRMGCGYVVLAQRKIFPSLSDPDFVFLDLNKKNWHDQKFDAVLVGPGFGVDKFTRDLIQDLKSQHGKKVILDADAIAACAKFKLFPVPKDWILTPHAGELSACLSLGAETLVKNREQALIESQKLMGGVLVLKGFRTLITDGEKLFQIRSGNEALAKAGTGDVLAGMITALRAAGVAAMDAALLGAYIHGATANLWEAKGMDLLSMRAIDVLDLTPRVLQILRKCGSKRE